MSNLSINTPDLWLHAFPRLESETHKYKRGHVGVMSGGLSRTGAARLAARGALRSGAGVVTLLSPPDALLVNAINSLAVIVRVVNGSEELVSIVKERKINALVIGPNNGVSEETSANVLAGLTTTAACILDADALSSFEGRLQELTDAISKRSAPVILTPHDAEFARLFSDIAEQKTGRAEQAYEAAKISGAIIVLKGGRTIIATPEAELSLSQNAPPSLATAGSGDVLAGMIAGLVAQGMEVYLAANCAVWLHGEAANAFGPGLIAEDLPEQLPSLYRSLLV